MEAATLDQPTAASVGTPDVVREFVWTRPIGHNGRGWKPVTQPDFDAGSAFHVAHDVLEHLDQMDDSLDTEMKAFGGHLYLRGVTGYWDLKEVYMTEEEDPVERIMREVFGKRVDNRSAAKHLVGDLFNFMSGDRRTLTQPPPQPLMDTDAESILSDTINLGEVKLAERVQGRHNAASQQWQERIAYAKDWIRAGYFESKARFGHLSPTARANMFLTVEKHVHNLTVSHLDDLRYGDTLIVTVRHDSQHQVHLEMRGRRWGDNKTMPFLS